MEWPPGWRAGRAAFLGIVWGKCIVRASLEQAARAATGLWGCLLPPPALLLWEGAGTGPRLWAGLGTFRETLPWAGGSSHSTDWATEVQRAGCCSGIARSSGPIPIPCPHLLAQGTGEHLLDLSPVAALLVGASKGGLGGVHWGHSSAEPPRWAGGSDGKGAETAPRCLGCGRAAHGVAGGGGSWGRIPQPPLCGCRKQGGLRVSLAAGAFPPRRCLSQRGSMDSGHWGHGRLWAGRGQGTQIEK